MALHAAQGPQLGVPQMVQSRGQFGSVGALFIGVDVSWVVALAVVSPIYYLAARLSGRSDLTAGKIAQRPTAALTSAP